MIHLKQTPGTCYLLTSLLGVGTEIESRQG